MSRLEKLALTFASVAEGRLDEAPRLWVGRSGSLLAVDFYGDPGDAIDLLETLKDVDVAPHLASLTLRSPDVGANGTREWWLGTLTSATFPVLSSVRVERNHPEAHNRGVIGSVDGESGELGALLACCPSLLTLEAPSAPDASFFRLPSHPLHHLNLDAGYNHNGFVRNIAASTCFPNLRVLEFGEYAETYMDDFASHVTPVADYEALFASPLMRQLSVLTLRNGRFPEAMVANISQPGPQLKLVRTGYAYDKFPRWD